MFYGKNESVLNMCFSRFPILWKVGDGQIFHRFSNMGPARIALKFRDWFTSFLQWRPIFQYGTQCTRARFTAQVSCSDKLAFPSVRSFASKGRLPKLATGVGVVHKWRHTLLGGGGHQICDKLWQGEGGESLVLWCHTSRFDIHAARSHTRKERCGGQYVSIPFIIVFCCNQWGNFFRYC